LPVRAVSDPKELHDLTAFFTWAAWSSVAERPGTTHSYTNNFPYDALAGNQQRFAREDMVIETWRIMQPLIDNPPPVHPYAPDSWGPKEADALVAGHGWHGPWITA
jgi:glucose-6-phosphate 1-dehydrogenase